MSPMLFQALLKEDLIPDRETWMARGAGTAQVAQMIPRVITLLLCRRQKARQYWESLGTLGVPVSTKGFSYKMRMVTRMELTELKCEKAGFLEG